MGCDRMAQPFLNLAQKLFMLGANPDFPFFQTLFAQTLAKGTLIIGGSFSTSSPESPPMSPWSG